MSKSKQIIESEAAALVREAGGSYLEAFRLLVSKREAEVTKTARSTVGQRKQALANAIAQVDHDRLMELHEKMADAISIIAINSQIELADGKLLTEAEKHSLMRQFLNERDIAELLAVSKDKLRELVFAHLDAELAAEGVEDPQNQNGEVQVPELGYRFVREACGRTGFSLDEDKLKGLLGDQWAEVCDSVTVPAQFIPEHTEYSFDEAKVIMLAQKDPSVLEKLKNCLEVGRWRTPKFTVRPLKS